MTHTSDQYLTMAEMAADQAEKAADGNAPNALLAQVFTGLAAAYATAAHVAAIREATEAQRQINEVRVGVRAPRDVTAGPDLLERKADRPDPAQGFPLDN